MRRITSLRWAAILLAAALLSGCQALAKQELKPVPKTLSHGRFVYLGNRACRRFVRRLERHQPGTRSDPFERYLAALAFLKHSFLPATDRLLFELRALAPPPSEAVAYRRLLATLNYEDLLVHHFFQAFDQSRVQQVHTLDRRLTKIGKRIDARAAKVGLKTCAEA